MGMGRFPFCGEAQGALAGPCYHSVDLAGGPRFRRGSATDQPEVASYQQETLQGTDAIDGTAGGILASSAMPSLRTLKVSAPAQVAGAIATSQANGYGRLMYQDATTCATMATDYPAQAAVVRAAGMTFIGSPTGATFAGCSVGQRATILQACDVFLYRRPDSQYTSYASWAQGVLADLAGYRGQSPGTEFWMELGISPPGESTAGGQEPIDYLYGQLLGLLDGSPNEPKLVRLHRSKVVEDWAMERQYNLMIRRGNSWLAGLGGV